MASRNRSEDVGFNPKPSEGSSNLGMSKEQVKRILESIGLGALIGIAGAYLLQLDFDDAVVERPITPVVYEQPTVYFDPFTQGYVDSRGYPIKDETQIPVGEYGIQVKVEGKQLPDQYGQVREVWTVYPRN